jgi:hypothetical protein
MAEESKTSLERGGEPVGRSLAPHPTAGKTSYRGVHAPEPKTMRGENGQPGYESGDYRYNTLKGYGR